MPLIEDDECSKCNSKKFDILFDELLNETRIIIYFCPDCRHTEIESIINDTSY